MKYSMIERNIAYMFFCQQNIFETYRHTCCTIPTLDFFRLPKYQVSFVFMEDVFLGRQPNKIKWTVKTKTSDCKLLLSRRQKSLWIRVLLYCTIAVMVTTYPHSIVKLLFSRSNTFLLLHGNLLWNSLLIKWPVMTYVRVSSKLRSGICGIKSGSDIVFVWNHFTH